MISRRHFLLAGGAAVVGGRAAAARRRRSLEEITLDDLRAIPAEAAVAEYLERIAALDRKGPALCAVIETNPDARAFARARDRGDGRHRPLHGVPVLVKDNIDTADRMTTTAGSLALAGSIPARDARVVERLRAAGAVILGKANMSEWANIRSSRSTSGWSARGGQCRNPYVLDRNPSGSSSGSAVAVAANLCAAAIGTETDGSIVSPASANGIVGVKPTLGLVGGAGIIPIAHSQDTAGSMARTVRDAAIVLGAIAEPRPVDFTRYLDNEGLRGARIGVWRKALGFDPRVDQLMERALATMSAGSATIVDPADVPHAGEYDEAEMEVLLHELKHNLGLYLRGLPNARVRSLADVIAFNEAHRDVELVHFGQELFREAEKKGPLTDAIYAAALEKCRRLAGREGIDAVVGKHSLDAIVAATGSPAWLTDHVNGDPYIGGASTPAAVAGYPHITVPLGFVSRLPVGISFFGPAGSEPVLFRLAFAFEQATRAREAPRFVPTLPA